MKTTICIEADDPERISRGINRDIHFSRFPWPDDHKGRIIVHQNNIDVVTSFRAAANQTTDWLRTITRNARNDASFRRQLGRPRPVPLAERLFRLMGGRHPPLASIEVKLVAPVELPLSDTSEILSLGSTDESYCMLAIRNVPSAERIIAILDGMIADHERDPYGPNSDYARREGEKQDDARSLITHLRACFSRPDYLDAGAEWSNPDVVRWVRLAAEDGDPELRARIVDVLETQVPKLKHPPSWATAILESRGRLN